MSSSENNVIVLPERSMIAFVEKCNRGFDFSIYSEIGVEFSIEIAKNFSLWGSTKSAETVKSYYYRNCVLFDWMLDMRDSDNFEELFLLLKNDHKESVISGKAQWDLLLGYFRSDLEDRKSISNRTKDNILAAIRPFLKQLRIRGVVPHVESLTKFKWKSRQKKSIAEISPLWDKNISEIKQSMEIMGLSEIECEQTQDFIEALIESGIECDKRKNLPEQILKLLEVRLSALREAAEKDFKKHYKKFRKGQILLKECDWDAAKFTEIRDKYYLLNVKQCREAGQFLSECFPQGSVGLGRLLKYIDTHYNGIVPYENDVDNTGFKHGNFITKIIWKGYLNTSTREVAARLYASSELMNAISVILMVDTAINVHSCRTVDRSCLTQSSLKDHVAFLWWKERNGGYQLIRDLDMNTDDKVSPGTVLKVLLETTESLSKYASKNQKNYCFYTTENVTNSSSGDRILNASGTAYLNWFKKFLERHDELKNLEFTLDMIRPSVLLKVALATKDPDAVKEMGQHKGYSISMIYIDKIPNQIIGERRIREFMEWLQVLSSVGIEDFAKKVGIDEKNYDLEKKKILTNNFGGISCKDPLAGEQEGVNKGERCWKIDKCLTCKLRQDIVVASVGNILSVMQWREKLMQAKKGFTNKSENTWDEKWILWDIFTQVMLNKWKVGTHRAAYKKARHQLESSTNPYPDLLELTI